MQRRARRKIFVRVETGRAGWYNGAEVIRMRGIARWDARPYARLDDEARQGAPFICRVAPGAGKIEIDWIDDGYSGAHEVFFRPREAGDWRRGGRTMDGLSDGKDYAFYVARADKSAQSDVRLARAGAAPGTAVNYLHPDDPVYACSGRALCSPSILRLPSGRILASMDVYAPGGPQNLTILFRSGDGGATWDYLCELMPCFWGSLFWHAGAVYMLATASEYGDLLIGSSPDEGATWEPPVRLFPGGGMADAGPHKAPMPVTRHAGRLWSGIDYGSWKRGGHANALLSADECADLMNPASWALTPFLRSDPAWPGASAGTTRGAIEGNAVPAPNGGILNVLRYNCGDALPACDRALVLRGDPENPEARLQFERFADMPGGSNSKFQLRRDPVSGNYYALASEIVDPERPAARNVLSLIASADLENWRVCARLVDHREADPAKVGFQYPDFDFDGDDLVCFSRTAWNGARNFHDANFITFHRVENFRNL